VFGPQLPRPDASPVTRAEQRGFFAGFAEKGETTVYACAAGDGVTRSGAADDELVRFASNANTSYRRSAWAKTHFREVTYAEDQLMAMDLATAGWRKVYEPRAAVYHSHNFGVVETFQRYVDDWAGMQRAFGHVEVKQLWRLPLKAAYQTRVYLRMLGSDETLSPAGKLSWSPRVALQACSRQLAGYLGPRFDKMPGWAQETLSREARLRRDKARHS
jgi:rhamnosyltransferase